MSRTISASSRKPYGLALVCRIWRAPRATVYRHREPPRTEPPRRPGPVGPRPDAALLAAIRAVLAGSPFHGEGHRKVWAELASRFRQRSWWNGQRRGNCGSRACEPRNAGCCG
jgi:putative transposase